MNEQAKIDYFTEDGSVAAVNARISGDTHDRLADVMRSLVHHLHAFIKDVELTQEEWGVAIDFLTRTGQMCDENRQEYILLSDVLGASMLVDAINNRRPTGATENTVLGPFHVDGAPEYAMGENITKQGGRETCLFEGHVKDLDGNPVEGARIDVWCDSEDGFYDVQQPDVQPRHNNRGVFTTGPDGRYWFRGIKPVSYPIPDDGPVGQMLTKLGRHPYRPAHMHFIVSAPGFDTVVTHTFVAGDDYLTSDAVFGVKESLIASYEPVEDGETKWRTAYDFVLHRSE
ncbi:6-chlorohydroxyquinol-1,2-dioxygenase [Rhodobacterales bacterium HKCCSP123]|nr:6-chlorohydroxyquinol-1,2-dioxygenase [Rhodobacterales bacterium HKCCSP123]